MNGGSKEHPAFWKTALAQLQSMTTPDIYRSWIAPIEVSSLENKVLTLKVPTVFFVTYLKRNCENKILHTLAMITGENLQIEYLASEEESQTTASITPFPQNSSSGEPKLANDFLGNSPSPSKPLQVGSKRLIKTTAGYVDTSHTFESFIVSSGTQFAHAAAKGVASHPGGKYNPLLIYGPSGLGKTHLLHAIAVHMLEQNPDAKICYLPAEQFVNDFIEALGKNSMGQFHAKYRSRFDVFLIDDVQFFGGKGRSEEEFFHTFNHLCGAHNQVVMTSDKPPKDLQNLEERLITRLQQGLVVDVKPPDLETRIAILKTKAEADDLYLPEDVCLMIASNIRSNVRELEGALVRLGAEASLNGTEITVEMAREALSDILNDNRNNHLTMESIHKCVSQYFRISASELNSDSRARKFAEPRQIAMYLSRKYAKKTFPEIASYFGGKDHSTVVHAIKKIETNIHTSPSLKKQIEEIQQLL